MGAVGNCLRDLQKSSDTVAGSKDAGNIGHELVIHHNIRTVELHPQSSRKARGSSGSERSEDAVYRMFSSVFRGNGRN